VGIFKKFLKREKIRERLFVLSIDGLPHSFLAEPSGRMLMPNLAALTASGAMGRMNSVLPTVSSVAWASYATGVNPGKHGIFGFVDRVPSPFATWVPTARDLKAPTLWELIGRTGKEVGVINVPLTYPPRQVNGFMVACFLSPDLASATYPPELTPQLLELDYRIEAESALAGHDQNAYLADLQDTMARRFKTAFQLIHSQSWDFFHLHVMGSDRVNHFHWGSWEDNAPGSAGFENFYRRLDSYIGELTEHLPPGCRLMILSEHGFTRAKGNVFVNRWLEENGYLLFGRGRKELKNMHPDSRAYSLVPGRIYINLEGREERGRVSAGKVYEDLRDELIHRLAALCHPETGQPVVEGVLRREEIYSGPHTSRAADLIIAPAAGFDLKANLSAPAVVRPPDLGGVHTYDDAFLFIQSAAALPAHNTFSIIDVTPTILKIMNIAAPQSMDGRVLL